MPIYVYEVIRKDGRPRARFEILQKMSDIPLKKHPETGQLIRRIIGSVSLPKNKFERAVRSTYGKNSPQAKKLLSGS